MATKEFKTKTLRLYVTDEHMDYRGTFIFHCYEFGWKEVRLKATCIETACIEACDTINGFIKVLQRDSDALRDQASRFVNESYPLGQEDDKA